MEDGEVGIDWVDIDGKGGLSKVLKEVMVVKYLLFFHLHLPGCICWRKQQLLLDQLLNVLLLLLLLPQSRTFV